MTIPADPERLPLALAWLVKLLDRHAVPYQIVGGLAAHAYGATRPVVDVDLYLPFDRGQLILAEIQPYIVRQPLPHHSELWDLVYLALVYEDVYIEIGVHLLLIHAFITVSMVVGRISVCHLIPRSQQLFLGWR